MVGIKAQEGATPLGPNGGGSDATSVNGEPLDLSECEQEPIHLLEHIQPHGVLLAVADDPDGRITHASANCADMLGTAAEDLLNRPLSEALPADLAALLRSRLTSFATQGSGATHGNITVCEPHLVKVDGRPQSWSLSVHRSGSRLVIEIEPAEARAQAKTADADPNPDALERTTSTHSREHGGDGEIDALHRLGDETVRAVAEVSGYDRVMLYMFHPDWSGEVIAETRRPDMVPYLGLRYPATDIPSQARRLYTLNLLRTIEDVAAAPVPVLSVPNGSDPQSGEPLDLTFSTLRSVSPYHIEYLRNMEVSATLTASVITDGELWGLIACHHRTPLRMTADVRAAVGRLAAALATRIETRQHRAAAHRQQVAARYITQLRTRLESGEPLPQALLTGPARIWELLGGEGGVVAAADSLAMVGLSPRPGTMRRILEIALASADDGLFITDRLGAHLSGTESGIAGVAIIFLSMDPVIAVGVFRPSESRDVFWAGDPSKPAERDPGRDRISPRRSFAAWKESHRDHARPWDAWTHCVLKQVAETARQHLPATDPLPRLGPAITALAEHLTPGATLTGGLMSGSAEGLALTVEEADGRVRLDMVNQTFRDLFGDLGDDETYTTLADRLGLPVDIHERAVLEPFTCECWSWRRGRRTLEISAWTVLTVANDSQTQSWRALSFRDVTESQRSARALASARERAELSSRLKSEFLSRVGHDLKTPLNAILGFSDMIRLGVGPTETNEQVVQYASIIHNAGTHLLAMIEDLLELSRFELGQNAPRDQTFDMVVLCQECMAWIKAYPGASDLSFSTNMPGRAVPVRADRTILARVLLNLLGNAVKFTRAGGTVDLTLRTDPAGSVTIEVTDSGIGIPDSEISTIFLPFRRGESADVAALEGTGLGLASAKTMVEAHGGHVEVTSSPGVGSTFRVVLPPDRCCDRAANAAALPASPAGAPDPSESS